MIVLLILLFLLYDLLMLILFFSLPKRVIKLLDKSENKEISVLVPVRDEEEHIKQILNCILKNDYQNFEVLVIDDHSTDLTAEVVKGIQDSRIRLITLAGSESGKKAGIKRGVQEAKGDWIVCTDGDTQVGTKWLQCYAEALEQNQMAFGPVKYEDSQGFWVDMLNMELSALVGVGAATLKLGHPGMINGCNYGFHKQAFREVEGFEGNEHLASGDDEFLLRKIYKRYPGKVQFLSSPTPLVVTEAVKSLREFYHQRIRWSSKWKHHRDWNSWFLPVFLFLVYAFGTFGVIQIWDQNLPIILSLIASKLIVDYFFLRRSSGISNSKISIPGFLLLQIIYPVYVVFFGIASNFGKFRWRKRSYKV
ncbi:glycosyltransferase [Reichenbachiella ulvae]|uniref:Glycosyltransferase n=1 Tax=Reichenbachiella ulvae TaxID=2980104 RepID=A0ABT3CSX7_9BACT|nr:glycosyltransferase [Reichenbachiella ulvae]MCV9386801.1 glycosyltransferase [Reichenbachiella ulvae]